MDIYYAIAFFVLGTIFGSFYNVVGYRVPLGKSIAYPASHCTKCNHQLGLAELIPILSFIMLGGKCKNCGQKVSWFYPIFEFFSGLLFSISYLKFGFSFDLIISLLFVSMLLIIIISDYQTFIIPDQVLISSSICLIIVLLMQKGFTGMLWSVLNGVISFGIMFLIKLLGDLIFKKESMGGGDIKLLFVFGLVLGWQASILSIFVGSFVGLPISLIKLRKDSSHIIPFGPFLAIGAIVLLFTGLDFSSMFNMMMK